jgi:2-methylisocitrate lyase-like PEP mutase family enzyme
LRCSVSHVAETIRLALDAGVAGCSVEDWRGSGIYEIDLAAARLAPVDPT